jgi:hypothetical protein
MVSPLTKIRLYLAVFIVGLVASGITAFPLLTELNLLCRILGVADVQSASGYSGLVWWILHVREGLTVTYGHYPFVAYGTDWLAFGHLVIAIFFIGPLLDPVRNIGVLYAGLIASVAVFPLALICGPIRGIPFYWRLIDCSFGVGGFIVLWAALTLTKQIAVKAD